MTALVEPPSAISTRDRVVERGRGQDPRRPQPLARPARPRARRPASAAAARRASTAGIAALPGSDMPSASTTAAMVEAVPISLQWPADGADRRLELVVLASAHPPGAELVGVLPEVGADAELAAAEDAGWPGRR